MKRSWILSVMLTLLAVILTGMGLVGCSPATGTVPTPTPDALCGNGLALPTAAGSRPHEMLDL